MISFKLTIIKLLIKKGIQESFFVGDAAGRSQDHSNADIEFATKLKLEFYTPEQYF